MQKLIPFKDIIPDKKIAKEYKSKGTKTLFPESTVETMKAYFSSL